MRHGNAFHGSFFVLAKKSGKTLELLSNEGFSSKRKGLKFF